MLRPHILLGPPGTGKTTSLLDMVERDLKNGTRPDRIGFFSFTRRAAIEARTRAEHRFGYTQADMPYFRTLHSLAYRQLAISRTSIMDHDEFRNFGDRIGLPISGVWNAEIGIYAGGTGEGDRYLFLENRARIRCHSYKEEFYQSGEYLDKDMFEWFCNSLNAYKERECLVDYTDMLERFIEEGVCPKFDSLYIDETQDLSLLQWRMVEKLAANSDRITVAGDDDQAIFRWAGADVDYFIDLKGTAKVLNRSYRVPRSIMAVANQVVRRISKRRPKVWQPRDAEGTVQFEVDPEYVDMSQGTWLVLARNNWFLRPLVEQCRLEGLYYSYKNKPSIDSETIRTILHWEQYRKYESEIRDKKDRARIRTYLGRNRSLLDETNRSNLPIWHEAFVGLPSRDRIYIIATRKRGERITGDPRIRITTIHGSKGAEADNVCLLSTIARKSYGEMMNNADDEHRVFYVGATRAKERLVVIEPQTTRFYRI